MFARGDSSLEPSRNWCTGDVIKVCVDLDRFRVEFEVARSALHCVYGLSMLSDQVRSERGARQEDDESAEEEKVLPDDLLFRYRMAIGCMLCAKSLLVCHIQATASTSCCRCR